MDTQIDQRFKRAWHFFTANAAAMLVSTLILALAWALVLPGPWVAFNLLQEVADAQRAGRPVRWQATYERPSNFIRAWGLFLVMGLGITVGLALCIVPGVLLALAWFHAPVLATQGRPVFESLGESYRMLRRTNAWSSTLLNGIFIFACMLAISLSAVFTLVAVPLALSYLALCTLDSEVPVVQDVPRPADIPA